MTRYYIRLVLWMVVVLIASITAVVIVFSGLQEKYYRPDLAGQLVDLEKELGRVLGGKNATEARMILDRIRDELVFDAEVVEEREQADAPFIVTIKDADYVIALASNKERVRRFKEQKGGYFLVWLFVVGLLVAGAGVFMVLPLVRKLRAQEKAIMRIAEGDLDARAPTGKRDALGQLGGCINKMADQIKNLVSSQRDLIHAVSHEMRTPTARIGFGLELLSEAASEDERAQRIEAIRKDLDEMDDLLGELLVFLKYGDSKEDVTREDLSVWEIAVAAKDRAAGIREDVEIQIEIGKDETISVEPKTFQRVLENLTRNAIRHAASVVLIRSQVGNGGVVAIDVEDDGTGIPEDQRASVFEPFVRLDPSRDRKVGGAGLGLAIAWRAMQRQGGGIEVGESSNLGGARFTILL